MSMLNKIPNNSSYKQMNKIEIILKYNFEIILALEDLAIVKLVIYEILLGNYTRKIIIKDK